MSTENMRTEESSEMSLKSETFDPVQTSNYVEAGCAQMDQNSETCHSAARKGTSASLSAKLIEILNKESKLISIIEYISSQAELSAVMEMGDIDPETIIQMGIEKLRKELARYSCDIDTTEPALVNAIETFYEQRRDFFENILRGCSRVELSTGCFKDKQTNSRPCFPEVSGLVRSVDETHAQMEVLKSKTLNIIDFKSSGGATKKNIFEYLHCLLTTLECLHNLMNAYHRAKQYMFSTCLNLNERRFATIILLVFSGIRDLVKSVKIEYSKFHSFVLDNCIIPK